jgi:hypothetical protein
MAIFSTGVIDNRRRAIRSLDIHAANIGSDPADMLLEVFHAGGAADGPSEQVLYVQRLVTVTPDRLHTFADIYADLDKVTVRITTSGLGQNAIAFSIAARDAQRREMTGLVAPNFNRFDQPQGPIFPQN